MPRTDWGWLITAEELRSWIISEDEGLLVVNKPAHVLCHPSKYGPWSSLVGACRELLSAERLHLVFRLDRETSGVVILARTPQLGSRLQRAVAQRRVRKTYLAILTGRLEESRTVDLPVGPDPNSAFVARQWVVPDSGRAARTTFQPLSYTRMGTPLPASICIRAAAIRFGFMPLISDIRFSATSCTVPTNA